MQNNEITPAPATKPGEIVDTRTLVAAPEISRTALLVKTSDLTVIGLAVSSGEGVPTHELQGEIIVHCLRGHVRLLAQGSSLELTSGQLLYYSANEPFSIEGMEMSILLVTVARTKTGETIELIG